MMRSITIIVVLAVTIALSCQVHAAPPVRTLYDDTFFEPSEAVETPHIRWAKPYYRGPVRALFITHRNAMREVVELAQRMSLDYKVFAAESPTKFGETGIGVDASWRLIRGNSAEELAERLRGDLAQRWDVIVIGNFRWDELPMDCRYLILKQVSEGTGLVGYLPKGEYEYLDRVLAQAKFHWGFHVWTGAAGDIPDYFGIGEFTGSVDIDNPHSGRACLRIVGTRAERGSKESPRGGYSQPFEVEPNTRYRFSAWYRTAGFEESGPGSISLHPVSGVALGKSEEWTQATAEFGTGDRTSMGIYLLNYGVGTVWYDDISLTRAGDDANLVPNPGFEQPGDQAEAFVDGFPFRALPAFAKYDSPQAFARGSFQVTRLRDGRIAFLQGFAVPKLQMMTPGPGGAPGENQADYDYYLALAARTILWGAGKEPEASIELPPAEAAQFDSAELPAELPLRVSAERAFGTCQVRLEVHDRAGHVWHEAAQDATVQEGDAELNFEIPRLPAGSYFGNLRLGQGDKVIDFSSAALEVTSATRLKEIALETDSFSCSEPVTGKVLVENPRPDCAIQLKVRDNFGRLVAETEMDAAAPEVPFSIETPRPLTIMSRLRAELRSGDELLDVAEAWYPVGDLYPDRADVQHVMWVSFTHDFISPHMAREFRRHGIDSQYTGFSPIAAQQNLWHLPYATRFVDKKTDWYQAVRTRTKEDLVRDPCLTDPEYREEVRKTLTDVAQRAAPYSTSDFTLGDENHIVAGSYDLCFSPTCIADFRRWCREQYGTIERLDAEWGSDHKSFDEVMPITLEQARETGNFPPWVDHRLHMESVWADIHDFSRQVIREVVPQARVGYEGSNVYVGSFHAADYWKLSRAMDLNDIYYRDFVSAAWHDFAAPGMLFGGGWFGGYAGNRNEPYMRWFPWRTLLKGANSFWVWMGCGSAGSVMAFDLSLYPFFEAACEEINDIKAGIGKMLMAAERQHDRIALLYSASSVHAATLTDGFPSMHDELNDAVKLLHDLGLECRVLSYQELAEGKLNIEECKLLLLPGAQALSEAEVSSIRAFVQDGGTVVADLRPGMCDEHGKRYEAGALDELFGVRLDTGQFAPAAGDLTLAGAQEDLGLDAALSLDGVTADGGVEATQGTALGAVGEAPALIAHTSGTGRSLLLNVALAGYAKRTGPGGKGGDFAGWADGEGTRALMVAVMEWAGVTPPVSVEPAQSQVEISRFRSGPMEYVGIIQGLPRPSLEYTNGQAHLPGPGPVTIHFDRASHVYDVRAHKYLGETDSISAQLQPGRALLYALLPYRVADASITAAQEATQGESVPYRVAVRPDGDQRATHVFRINVIGPDGAEQPYYAQNLLGEDGRASGELTFALDDMPGAWTIEAVDVATGVTATAGVQLKAR